MNFFRTFYAKLSGLFLILILVLGAVIAYICVRSSFRFVDEVDQKVHRALADTMAAEFEPLVADSIATAAIRERIGYLMGINPRIEIYLLGSTGMIKAAFPDEGVVRQAVDPAPLRRYLHDGELPILGDDPRHEARTKPFATADLTIMGEEGCFLYIILAGQRYESTAAMVRDSYIMQGALEGLGLTLLMTAGLGLLLFRLLTRRLRGMQRVVAAFEAGQYDRRITIRTDDELGALATSFNQMADTLKAQMDALRRVDRLRRDLVANVSHDLRGPLASVQGYIETIAMKDAKLDTDERRRYLDTVLQNTRRLGSLIDELFELSKLDARQVEPRFEAFPLAELVQDIVMQFRPRAAAAGVTLRAERPAELPLVVADLALVERALANLIDNAIKHTPAGGTVRIIADDAGESVHLRVTDTGRGIPAEDLPHIFERFYRVDKSRGSDRGSAGLGLAITKKILELHDSAIEVQSRLHEGTTFAFTLPTVRSTFAQEHGMQPA